MLRSRILPYLLVALVSIPGFLIGQKLRSGEPLNAFILLPLMLAIVAIASALMRQSRE